MWTHNVAIFSFAKPSPGSTVASNRIAAFVSGLLSAPLFYDATVEQVRARTLIIVNGAFAFCGCLPQLAEAILAAGNIIWVQNDYTIAPPKVTSKGESPFRAAFRLREERGLPPMDYWTTVSDMSKETPNSHYINWNSLTFEKRPLRKFNGRKRHLFYYGAYRVKREPYFISYLNHDRAVISSTSEKFLATCPEALKIDPIGGPQFYDELATKCFGLYIEDPKSHSSFHSPANRFYEMLSAGLPMLFQPESEEMLAHAGFHVAKYAVAPGDVQAVLDAPTGKLRDKVQKGQRDLWGNIDYVGNLVQAVDWAASQYKRAGTKTRGL